MTPTRNSASTLRSLAAGAMLNAAAVAPALAAPSFAFPSFAFPSFAFHFDIASLAARDFLLWGSVALLVVALSAKIVQDRYREEAVPPGPDLRWWKNPPPSPQP